MSIKLTVYFDEPWWVGVFEQEENDTIRLFRYVFGSEPSIAEVYELVLHQMAQLFEQPVINVATSKTPINHVNPKRVKREVAQQMRLQGLSTKSQEAMRLLIEASKQVHQTQSKAQREEQAAYKRQKLKEKALARKRDH
jgi:hypothetical protein